MINDLIYIHRADKSSSYALQVGSGTDYVLILLSEYDQCLLLSLTFSRTLTISFVFGASNFSSSRTISSFSATFAESADFSASLFTFFGIA